MPIRALAGPNPGTGRPQYVCSRNAALLVWATSSRHSTKRGQALQVVSSSSSAANSPERSTPSSEIMSSFSDTRPGRFSERWDVVFPGTNSGVGDGSGGSGVDGVAGGEWAGRVGGVGWVGGWGG